MATSTVTIINPYKLPGRLEVFFDFDGLRTLCTRDDLSMVFDGMHGIGRSTDASIEGHSLVPVLGGGQ